MRKTFAKPLKDLLSRGRRALARSLNPEARGVLGYNRARWRSVNDLPPVTADEADEWEDRCVVVWQRASHSSDQGVEVTNLGALRGGDYSDDSKVGAVWRSVMDAEVFDSTYGRERRAVENCTFARSARIGTMAAVGFFLVVAALWLITGVAGEFVLPLGLTAGILVFFNYGGTARGNSRSQIIATSRWLWLFSLPCVVLIGSARSMASALFCGGLTLVVFLWMWKTRSLLLRIAFYPGRLKNLPAPVSGELLLAACCSGAYTQIAYCEALGVSGEKGMRALVSGLEDSALSRQLTDGELSDLGASLIWLPDDASTEDIFLALDNGGFMERAYETISTITGLEPDVIRRRLKDNIMCENIPNQILLERLVA